MESARVQCLHTSCGVSEIEQVSEANKCDFWYKKLIIILYKKLIIIL